MPKLKVDLIVDDKGSVTVRKFSSDTEKYMHTAAGSVQNLTRYLAGLSGVMAGLGLGFSAAKIIETADSYSLLRDRLSLVTKSAGELHEVQTALYAISQDSRTAYAGTIDLYTRMARATKDTGVSQQDLLTVTEAINKSLVISGSSAQAAEAALIQLGQGMASGTLRGEELNSVLEQAPRLAEALASGMGVSVGKLRELGKEGKITTENVVQALLNQSSAIDREYSKMSATVGQAMTVLNNSIGGVIAGTNESTSATGQLAGAIINVAGEVDKWAASNQELLKQDLPRYLENTKAVASDLVALGQAMPGDAMDMGIVGYALFRGGPGLAGLVAGALTLNTQLEKIGALKGLSFSGMADSLAAAYGNSKNIMNALSGQVDPYLGLPMGMDSMYSSHGGASALDMGASHVDLEKLQAIDSALRAAFSASIDLGDKGSDAMEKYERKVMAVDSAIEHYFDTIDQHSRDLADAEIAALDSFYSLTDEQEMQRVDELWSARMERMKDSTAGAAFSMSDDLLRVQTVGETVAGRLEDGMVQAFENVTTGAKGMGDIVTDILQSIANEIMRVMVIQPMVAGLMSPFQTAGVDAALSSFFSFHTGGVVGRDGSPGFAPASLWDNAQRYHTGGVAGLKPDEIPIIAQRGETIIPKGGSVGGVSVSIGNIVVESKGNGGTDYSNAQQMGAMVATALKNEIKSVLMGEQRPGGILNPQGAY